MLRAGIVGLPNVGKSTLFNAVTRTRKAEAANYPFCTIDPNVGIVTVPDARLAVLQKIAKTNVVIPAAIEFVDIAGLVKGASQGEGLGNKFLHATSARSTRSSRSCAASRTRTSTTSPGSVDPVRDIEVINTELMLADLESVQEAAGARRQGHRRRARRRRRRRTRSLAKIETALDAGKPALTVRADAGGEGDRARVLPAVGQADDLRLQREGHRSRRRRRQPLRRQGPRLREDAPRLRGGGRSARRSRASWST